MNGKLVGEIDFEKYHTFFLEYWKEDDTYRSHLVRPCTETYETLTDKNTNKWVTIGAAVLVFDNSMTLSEILINCSLYGVSIDFIDIKAITDEYRKNRWASKDSRIIQTIDTHREDVAKYIESIEAPRHYVALNKRKRDVLKFVVIDRFLQNSKINFLKGEYDGKAAIAGFKSNDDAKAYCQKMNNKK